MKYELQTNNGDITGIIVICDMEETKTMTKNDLEEFLNNQLLETYGISVTVNEEQFYELKDNGKVVIKLVTTETKEVEVDSKNIDLDTTSKTENNFRLASKTNKLAYQIMNEFYKRSFYITKAHTERGRSIYYTNIDFTSSTEFHMVCDILAGEEIKLLEKIGSSVRPNSSGIDNRTVSYYNVVEKGDVIYVKLICKIEDSYGLDLIMTYKLEHKDRILENIISKEFSI